MASDRVAIRRLTETDLDAVAAVHINAFPDSALTKLGREAVRRYYEWQMVGPHDSVCIGAFENENLLGFCFGGVFKGALGGFLEKNRAFLVREVLKRPWLLTNSLFRERAQFAVKRVFGKLRFRRASQVANPVTSQRTTKRHFGILSIAVDPKYQGRGAAQLLMEYSERIALEQGFNRMGLTVHPSNGRAVRFYEKVGWMKEPVHGKWTGRMSKSIGPQNADSLAQED